MSVLFESSEINGMTLRNRFVRSATWEGMATTEGEVTPKLVETMAALARGGVGLIITGHAYVSQDGQAAPLQLGAHRDDLIDGLRLMADSVHEHGGRIVMQLAHAGRFTAHKITGTPPWVVSNFEGLSKSPCRELTVHHIEEIVQCFGDAARRAKAAGFDGVQIHAAHGYLLSQFLSPEFNRREDQYGGAIANRTRALLEVYQAVRETVGAEFPILVKLNCGDFVDNGLTPEDSARVGRMLDKAGMDAIELSGGLLTGGALSPSRPGINTENKEAYFRQEAHSFKEGIDIPLILVGGIRSFQVAERLVNEGDADYVSMSRPFIREPDLVSRWQSGDLDRAKCVSDNLCFVAGAKGQGIYCETERRQKKE